jgi:hypothetical protein
MIVTTITQQQAETNPLYKDGLGLINPNDEEKSFFIAHGKIGGRYGSLIFNHNAYTEWCEKHPTSEGKDCQEKIIIL